ncbi:NAD(P)H-binding protein, partial [Waterburya agarophytonicola K14]
MKKVLVTGATGRTGSLVFKKLANQPKEFTVIGFARSPEKIEQMFGLTKNFIVGNISNQSQIEAAMEDCDGLVILTSAIPKMVVPPSQGKPPEFAYNLGEMPETVDYQGQVNQINAATHLPHVKMYYLEFHKIS